MDPDDLLDRSAPPIAERTPALTDLLEDMASSSRPRRRRRRGLALVAGGGALAAGLAVAGTAAAVLVYTNQNVPDATVERTVSWTSSTGHHCFVAFEFGPRPVTDPNYSADQGDALRAARDWVETLDLGSMHPRAFVEHWYRHLQRISADHASRAALVEHYGNRSDELEASAVMFGLTAKGNAYLRSHGFDPRSLNSGPSAGCDQ